VGLRFNNLTIPQWATILEAWIQFKVDEVSTTATTLTIQAQAADNALTFSTAGGNISSRPRTAAAVQWTPAGWNTVGEAGLPQRTPDITAVTQEVINRPGWASGNSLVVIITGDGTGKRVAESYDGDAAGAALLSVRYSSGGTPSNQVPTVNAGPDQTITLPSSATLTGTASVDGLPSGTLTTTWSQVSGLGTVTFANSIALATTATFSLAGVYQLRLTANDGALSASDEVQMTVNPAPSGDIVVFEKRVAASSDDAEEANSTGSVGLSSSDLELIQESAAQTVGMRFTGLAIPPGATILSAYVQFKVDEATPGATALTIQAEAADNPGTFTTATGNISSRARTGAAMPWAPPEWPAVGEAGAAQRTADIAAVIQEIVSRPGWASGNALVIIITGTGKRVAESYNGDAPGAPLLHIEYRQAN